MLAASRRARRTDYPGASLRERVAISTAPSPASKPLLPLFSPARSMACSRVSQVRTQNIIGTPVSSWASWMPREVSRRDIVVVRGFAAQNAADADDRVEAAGRGKFFCGDGNFKRARHAHDFDLLFVAPARDRASSAPSSRRSVMKLLNRLTTIPKCRPVGVQVPSTHRSAFALGSAMAQRP